MNIKKLLPLLLFLLSFLPAAGIAAQEATPTVITVQAERWNELKSNNSKLVLKLTELELLLSTLKTPQAELTARLNEARAQAKNLQAALTLSAERLKNAENLQKRTQESLIELEKRITEERAAERRTQARLKRQRNFAYFLTAAALLYVYTD